LQLDWQVIYEENKLVFEIENHRYETIDGGQNIFKYVDGVFVKRIRQFPEKPDNWLQPHMPQPMSAPLDQWEPEMDYLLETFPQLGEKHFVTTYRQRDGNLIEEDSVRGMGVNNLTDLISVNRLGQPAYVQERWDWVQLASVVYEHIPNTMLEQDPNINKAPAGLCWGKNKDTGVIQRYGNSQNCPCHVFPQIYPPVTLSEDEWKEDVVRYNGVFD